MKPRNKILLALSAGVLGATAIFAADRMVLVYGNAEVEMAVLDGTAHAALTGNEALAPAGIRVVRVEGSRVLTAEHSPQAGTRAYFLASGGGFSFSGFQLNGASIAFAVDGAESAPPLKKPIVSPLPVYASALTRVTANSGSLRFDYSQKDAGRVSVEVISMSGGVLARSAWVGEPGFYSRALNVPGASSRQVLLIRWREGKNQQLKKVIAQ